MLEVPLNGPGKPSREQRRQLTRRQQLASSQTSPICLEGSLSLRRRPATLLRPQRRISGEVFNVGVAISAFNPALSVRHRNQGHEFVPTLDNPIYPHTKYPHATWPTILFQCTWKTNRCRLYSPTIRYLNPMISIMPWKRLPLSVPFLFNLNPSPCQPSALSILKPEGTHRQTLAHLPVAPSRPQCTLPGAGGGEAAARGDVHAVRASARVGSPPGARGHHERAVLPDRGVRGLPWHAQQQEGPGGPR